MKSRVDFAKKYDYVVDGKKTKLSGSEDMLPCVWTRTITENQRQRFGNEFEANIERKG